MVLEAKTPTERRLKEYLDANASDALRDKIAALPDGPRFNLAAAFRFITSEARKHLDGTSGFVEDDTVFGWLVHYYEDVAPAEAAKPAAPATGVNGNKKAKPRKTKSHKAAQAKAAKSNAAPASDAPAATGEKPASPVPEVPPASDAPAHAPEAADTGFAFELFEGPAA
jgi:hypothetical protein